MGLTGPRTHPLNGAAIGAACVVGIVLGIFAHAVVQPAPPPSQLDRAPAERASADSALRAPHTASPARSSTGHCAHVQSADDWYLHGDQQCCRPETPSFVDIANRHTTDKVTTHRYGPAYTRYVAPLRCRSDLRFLEIGLGCGMPYGEGHSLTLWMEYFPHAEAIVEMEFQADCLSALSTAWKEKPPKWVKASTETWAKALRPVHFIVGDQRDSASIRHVGEQHGPFDVIIDDGGHLMEMQIKTIAAMWPFLRPGGVLLMEDLQTSFDNIADPRIFWPTTTVHYIAKLQEALHVRSNGNGLDPAVYIGFNDVLATLESAHCFEEACVLVKKA